MNRTTIWLSSEDKKAIEVIKDKYGLDNNSAAIRLALRILAASKLAEIYERIQDTPGTK